MHMRLVLPLVVLLAAGALHATSALQLDLETLTDKSDLIVVGKVDSKEARWDAARAGIWTHHEVTVSETLKGKHEKTRDVVIRGGVVGDIGQHVSGAGSLKVGTEYVLFLWKDDDDRYRLQGMVQGAFEITEKDDVKRAKNSLSGLRIVDAETLKPLKGAKALEFKLADLKTKVNEQLKKEDA